MDKETLALENFKNIQELIRFLDQKASFILVVYGFILTVFFEVSKSLKWEGCNNAGFWGWVSFLSGFTVLLLLLGQVYMLIFKVIKPRLAEHYKEGDYSLYYFEHIAYEGQDKLLKSYKELDNDSSLIIKILADQTFEVAKILKSKTEALELSMSILFWVVIALVVFIFSSRLLG